MRARPAIALVLGLFLSVSGVLSGARTVRAAEQCFTATNQCVGGAFLDYWLAHGDLAINGYPLTGVVWQTLEDGKSYQVQYFERVRMEAHPEQSDPKYQIMLGQFGRAIHPADPPAPEVPGWAYFSATGQSVPPSFAAYWTTYGGLDQFGLPVSGVIRETLEDGNSYDVQYFERARFEAHPENPAPQDIQLGQFGRRILSALPPGSLGATPGAATPAPAPTPTPTTAPTPAPASGRSAPVNGTCPAGYPIKGNRSSMIYHVPGGAYYNRTIPEDCFATAADAEAAGYRASQR